jgi:NTP pyrophosphatase (non-canonical NTP hydrolase)
VSIDWNDIRQVQRHINEWADHTFGYGRDPQASLSKLVLEEIPELLSHKKVRGLEGIDLEFADTLILLLDLADMWGIDVPKALENKMSINHKRRWKLDESTGFYNHERANKGGPDGQQ